MGKFGTSTGEQVARLISNIYLYTFDANGNVGQLVDSSTGIISTHYEYDPFGKLLVATGSEADNNIFRFSTKYVDTETELYYYGYRYYSPELGRWVTRDPIEEDGGLNLYGFVGNNPINYIDPLGLKLKSGDVIRVKCGGFLGIAPDYGGTIYIRAYRILPGLPGVGGVEMRAKFDESDPCCCPGREYRWIQTVTEDTSPYRPAAPPYNDPQPPDDPLPYYWTNLELPAYSGPNYLELIDLPRDPRASLAGQNSVVVKFKTCLVCSSNGDKELKCFEWGYKYYRSWWTGNWWTGNIDVKLL